MKINPEDKIIMKFYDEDMDFEALLVTKYKNEEAIIKVLEDYRKKMESYNWDEFVFLLKEEKLHTEFEVLRVLKYYF